MKNDSEKSFIENQNTTNCWEALYIWTCFTNKVYWSPNNRSQILTRYSTWQSSHVTYSPLHLTVVPNSSYQAHTPQGKSRSTSSIIIQVSIFGTISYKFDVPLHITVRNYAAKHRLSTRKMSWVFAVKHVQHSLMMDRKWSKTCQSDF